MRIAADVTQFENLGQQARPLWFPACHLCQRYSRKLSDNPGRGAIRFRSGTAPHFSQRSKRRLFNCKVWAICFTFNPCRRSLITAANIFRSCCRRCCAISSL